MLDLASFTGPQAFGKAYRQMLDNDAHAPDSVGREIASSMIRLCEETASHLYDAHTDLDIGYVAGSRSGLESFLARAEPPPSDPAQQVAAIAELTSGLAAKGPADGLSGMRFGGTEEEIIERGSDWCTDVARAGCALYTRWLDFPAAWCISST